MKSLYITCLLVVSEFVASIPQGKGGAGGCSTLEVVVARGTSEPGTYGLIVGDPFVSAVKRAVPGATGHNINYPADFTAASPDKGAEVVVQYFNTKPKQCPNQKYVIVGYSQGCVVQRRAMVKLDAATLNKIIAVVTFGDPGLKSTTAPMGGPVPKWPPVLESRFNTNCASGDPVCDKSGSNVLMHLTYNSGSYMSKSATYVKNQVSKQDVKG